MVNTATIFNQVNTIIWLINIQNASCPFGTLRSNNNLFNLVSLVFLIYLSYALAVGHNGLEDQVEDLLVDAGVLKEALVLEVELLVSYELYEGVGDSPGMRLLDDEPFDYDPKIPV